ncbi:glutamine synthetase-like [Littorina saxatilis]|uniref:Lengsin n=1 Tax=Littorina saxatilis TaxID=31220 RepID=A0AAN9BM32_9CAEN
MLASVSDKDRSKEDADVAILLDSLDYVHFVVPDINGIPRGRVVPRRFVRQTLKTGIDLFHGTLVFGPRTEATDQIEELEREPGNRTWQPDPATLTPTPWSDSTPSRGHCTVRVTSNKVTRDAGNAADDGNDRNNDNADDNNDVTGNKIRLSGAGMNVTSSNSKVIRSGQKVSGNYGDKVTGNRRTTGMVLCQLLTADGRVDDLDLRHVVQRLLNKLSQDHGLVFKAAFEYEFVVFKKDTLKPLGSDSFQLLDVRTTQPDLDLLYELSEELDEGGFHVTSIQPEFTPGQWELNFEPQEGLWAADFAFHVKNAVKIFFARRGYTATFMSFPKLRGSSSGLHLNHSLWTRDGRNAMKDGSKQNSLSELALRWNAGLVQHAPAMTSLCCPTVNCYRRLHLSGCPSHATWSIDNRNSLNRFKTKGGNVYLESRLPSGTANPYLAVACHLAAGMSALSQEVTSPPPMDTEHAQTLPKSLEEAFQALEDDKVVQNALGHQLISYYVAAKRDYEIKAFNQKHFKTDEEKIAFERERYLVSL